ncbi:MAG: acylphosphatase [Caldiserica bacterium]|nr:MAG: acylphosphatase [Caldisericota bacterium]
MSKRSFEAKISGIVQGVGFRWYALRYAKAFDISGFVKNLPDGRVLVRAKGDEENLKQFLDILRKGPSGSVVEDVDVKWDVDVDDGEFRIEF